jgi:hypothetical protein
MSFIRVRGRVRIVVGEPGGKSRHIECDNLFTDYGLFLLMFWLFGTASKPTVGSTNPTGTYGIGDGTRYNDGVNVYPSPFDGNSNSLSGPASGVAFTNGFGQDRVTMNNTASSGIVSNYPQLGIDAAAISNSPQATYLLGPFSWMGAILMATNDSTNPSETSMVFGSGVYALWSNMDAGVSVAVTSAWTLSGSTTTSTPPTAQWVFTNTNAAKAAMTIYSFAWTLPFKVGSVTAGTGPTQQTSLSTVYSSGTGTSLTGWPIIAKVTLQTPIQVAAGGKLSVVTYSFQLAN